MARTMFRLLGPFSVHLDGAPLSGTVTGPARSLLIYCLLNANQRHRRDCLMAQVWEDEAPPSRAAFNTALWRLRRFVDPLPGVTLDQDADTLRLTLGDAARCDALDLLALMPAPGSDPARGCISDIVDHWRGPFAEGQSQHWALIARERVHAAYHLALTALMRDAADHGRYEMALDYGQRILADDPFREAVHTEMLWLWVLTGQRARAIRAHRAFCAVLRDELDIGPMAETAALFDYIVEGLERQPKVMGAPAQADTAQRYQGYLRALAHQRAEVYQAIRGRALTH